MPLEEFTLILAELRRKLIYIAAVFGAGAVFSFSYLMNQVINKIKHDLFYGLQQYDESGPSGQLVDISNSLDLISKELAINNSAIAQNLTNISGEILTISQSLNTSELVYLAPLEVVMLKFKMSLIFGILIASPLILYYAYRGIKGRFRNVIHVNKLLMISIILAFIVLFLIGAGYSYFYMLPLFLRFVYQDAINTGVIANFSIYEFIYFIVMMSIILGLSFELPLVMALLVRLGVTSRQTLAHYRKHAYVILLIIAAFITPDPTMFSQVMVALPFVVLYEVSLLFMGFAEKIKVT
ncbi:Sec-independent protein secretion pathway component TatC [Candidatus Methanoperedens nitroreducens]|uniref:Sec-independent protein translocase protein TatC n=1 Tax=Candidatus Methanoperedens nitratireducens TaxID=1392998 RepID=A0A062V7R0_9EURY|nr:twin-arginine translocase subunit TatC [Candidatus Methanoperedens nitroreducens]KCZ72603.1 Sec-independent protein secretion pathway component TatC [Candidatus Methanoperedens nitroreducens]MDJ1423465.1 twin-arginine translocase subunit TatC [Candidatus Methanoperedens sp.]